MVGAMVAVGANAIENGTGNGNGTVNRHPIITRHHSRLLPWPALRAQRRHRAGDAAITLEVHLLTMLCRRVTRTRRGHRRPSRLPILIQKLRSGSSSMIAIEWEHSFLLRRVHQEARRVPRPVTGAGAESYRRCPGDKGCDAQLSRGGVECARSDPDYLECARPQPGAHREHRERVHRPRRRRGEEAGLARFVEWVCC